MSDKKWERKSSQAQAKNFSQFEDIDFPEQKLNQMLETLPSFISENKPAYLVGEAEYDDYSEKIETINKEEEFSDFLHHSLNKKYHYEALSKKEKINQTNVNIFEKYKSDLARELKSLRQEYNLSKKQQQKLEKRYQDLGPFPNKDKYGRQIFKTNHHRDASTNLDQELDQELNALSETMNIPLNELKKHEAKMAYVKPQAKPKPTIKPNINFKTANLDQNSASEIKILEAKITLAKIEAKKAEAEAARAKAEAEIEYYKTQTIKLDQLNKRKWWRRKKHQKKHP